MEQLHGLLGFDAEAAPELPSVVGEGVGDLRSGPFQAALQGSQVGAEVEEVLPYRKGRVGHHEEAVGLTGLPGLPGPEDLGEGDGGCEIRVGEHPEYHGKGAGAAQAHRPRGPGRLVSFGLVVAFHVRAQIPLPCVRAGGPVVGDLVGRQEQRRDGVDQRRLA